MWKGKDEQGRQPLEVPAVPIYIQEKIHPQAIVEDLRERAAAGKDRPLDLFADFNGVELDPGKRTEFYQHDRHWTNRLILGVEVRGVDVFDPTTGEIRSSGPDDIACWFIDTDYNGESFFVRHAYFLGGQEPYEKLKRALRAEIDEAEWSKLYSAKSVPFEAPRKGKIAVKVINHYGDEVLKVYAVGK